MVCYDEDRKRLYDLLTEGRMIVLPPSVHPGTGAPHAADAHLVELLDERATLPGDYHETIASALSAIGVTAKPSAPFAWRPPAPAEVD